MSRNHGKRDFMCGLGQGEKYSLRPRSIAKRLEVEQKLKQPVLAKRAPKPKQKPAPLSKYRRKTANARERSRMKEINQAFETLRRAIPAAADSPSPYSPHHSASSPSPSSSSSSSSDRSSYGGGGGGSSSSSSNCEKWTKITTLRLAMDYIEALTRVLEHDALLVINDDDGFCSSGLLISDRGSLSSLGSIGSHHGGCSSSSGGDLLSDDLDSFDDIPNIGTSVINDHCCGDDDMAFDIFLESDNGGDSLHCAFHHHHPELVDTPQPNTP